MPGDELDRYPTFLATRAITINGGPQAIWPWLVQMGYKRAGFYGYDILDNPSNPRGLRSARTILPEFQHFHVGDDVPLSALGGLVFADIQPNRYLTWTGRSGRGAFTWALYPIDRDHTRLISRIRWTHHWKDPSLLAIDLFTDFTDHLAVRKILQGVKQRVEGQVEPGWQADFEFATYVGSAMIFAAAVLLVAMCPLTWTRWLTGAVAGIVWLITWYAPIPISLDVVLEMLVLFALAFGFGRRRVQRPLTLPGE